MKTTFYHFTAVARWPHKPLVRREICSSLWGGLKRRFAKCLACVVMPDHLHLILATLRPDLCAQAFSAELGAFTQRWFRGVSPWHLPHSSTPIKDERHLMRTIRYVHLNPCREGLVRDPLEWEWSTHRDAVGAVAEPWVDASALAKVFGVSPGRLKGELHRYISSDPSVRVQGTVLPTATRQPLIVTLPQVERAVLTAERVVRAGPGTRSRIVRLAQSLGEFKQEDLGLQLKCSRWTMARAAALPPTPRDPAVFEAARLILSDERLRRDWE